MLLGELVAVSAAVAGTSARLEKIALLARLLARLQPVEVPIAIGFLVGLPRQGRFGVGWATAAAARPSGAVNTSELTLEEVDAAFSALQSLSGPRSTTARKRLLAGLLTRATPPEQDFLQALLTGGIRQGALEGVVLEAVAQAAGLSGDRVRRAVMLAGDLGAVAEALQREGNTALDQYQVQLFRPLRPMLAESAGSVAAALAALGQAVVEWKLDGARIQVHRRQGRVAVYTRNLNDVSDRVPEVIAAVLSLPARELILDGEVIALRTDGSPLPFQDTMQRLGRRHEAERLRSERPLTPFFFDVLWVDGEPLLDAPLSARLERLDTVVPPSLRVPRLLTENISEAERFLAATLERGHEGVMAKSPGSAYAAGRRGAAWLKLKTPRTLDLVVLAAEWGSGRRTGWLSNLHLGARDPASGSFVMLGKTFKGMTDELLRWQTRELLARETRREDHVVYVRPELVVEVAFNEVQRSSQYPGGVTLRFARIKGYRPDKPAAEADTIETVRQFA